MSSPSGEGTDQDVPRSVRSLLGHALWRGADLVRIDAQGITYRLDGVPRRVLELPALLIRELHDHVRSLLDSAPEVLPGHRLRLDLRDQPHDFLVSSTGPETVVRMPAAPLALEDLGLGAAARDWLEGALGPPGLLLIASPPGQGRTTTLLSLLARPRAGGLAVCAGRTPLAPVQGLQHLWLEPGPPLSRLVEQLPAVLGLDDLAGGEALALAVRCARAGGRVLLTRPALDAASALEMTLEEGAPLEELLGALRGILVQVLGRRSCPDCRGAGCTGCFDGGFRGRVGLFEGVDGVRFRDAYASHADLRRAVREATAFHRFEEAALWLEPDVLTPAEVLRCAPSEAPAISVCGGQTREIVSRLRQEGYAVAWAERLQSLREHLLLRPAAVILRPSETAEGLQALRRNREGLSGFPGPVLLLCEGFTREGVRESLGAGADDCLPPDPERLVLRLKALLR